MSRLGQHLELSQLVLIETPGIVAAKDSGVVVLAQVRAWCIPWIGDFGSMLKLHSLERDDAPNVYDLRLLYLTEHIFGAVGCTPGGLESLQAKLREHPSGTWPSEDLAALALNAAEEEADEVEINRVLEGEPGEALIRRPMIAFGKDHILGDSPYSPKVGSPRRIFGILKHGMGCLLQLEINHPDVKCSTAQGSGPSIPPIPASPLLQKSTGKRSALTIKIPPARVVSPRRQKPPASRNTPSSQSTKLPLIPKPMLTPSIKSADAGRSNSQVRGSL